MRGAAVLTVGLTAFATFAASTISHAQSAASPWPMFLHDRAHTGWSGADARAISGTPNWKFSPDGVRRLLPPVIGADGTIYLGGTGLNPNSRHMSPVEYLYAVGPDGKLKWTFGDFMSPSMDESFCPSIGTDGTIYVGNSEYQSNHIAAGHLYAINPNGTLKWKFAIGSWVSSSTTIGAAFRPGLPRRGCRPRNRCKMTPSVEIRGAIQNGCRYPVRAFRFFAGRTRPDRKADIS